MSDLNVPNNMVDLNIFKITIGCDVIQLVQHVHTRYPDLVESKFSIINTIKTELKAHVLNRNALAGFHLVISYSDNKGVDTLVFTLY